MGLMFPSEYQMDGVFKNTHIQGKSLVPTVGNKILDVNKICCSSLSANSLLGSLYMHKIAQQFTPIISFNLPSISEKPILLFLHLTVE